jgi:hypothetical protein
VFGERLAPGFADRYLARHGFSAQTTGQPRDPARPANLFAPVPGDPAAHGRFDAQARDRDLIAPATARLGAAGVTAIAAAVLGGGLAAAIAGALWLLRRRQSL